MSTVKTNTITNVASTHTLTLDDVGYPLSTAWDGTLLTTTTTPTLASVGIIGLNPIAYIYPDGTITGESDNGEFTKWANGNMECTRGVGIQNGTIDYCVQFSTVLSVNCYVTEASIGYSVTAVSSVSHTTTSIDAKVFYYSGSGFTAISKTVDILIVGRWK